MPYIEGSKRPPVDQVLDPLIDYLKSLPVEEQDGTINYAVTRIIDSVYPLRYFHINRAMGVLSCIQSEYYRRVAGPYEDGKVADPRNGEVYVNLLKK